MVIGERSVGWRNFTELINFMTFHNQITFGGDADLFGAQLKVNIELGSFRL